MKMIIVKYHKDFFKDLQKLCQEYSSLKSKFRIISKQIEIYPLNVKHKKLKGYENLYRYKILGNLRIIIKFENNEIIYLYIGKRKNIYRKI